MATPRQQPSRHCKTEESWHDRLTEFSREINLSIRGAPLPSNERSSVAGKPGPVIKQSPPDPQPSSSSTVARPLPPKAATSRKPLQSKASDARPPQPVTRPRPIPFKDAIALPPLQPKATNDRPLKGKPLQPKPTVNARSSPLQGKAAPRKYLQMTAAISHKSTNCRPPLQPKKASNARSSPLQSKPSNSRKSLQSKPSKALPSSSSSSTPYGTRGKLKLSSAKRRRSPSPEVVPAKRRKKSSLPSAKSDSFLSSHSDTDEENIPPSVHAEDDEEDSSETDEENIEPPPILERYDARDDPKRKVLPALKEVKPRKPKATPASTKSSNPVVKTNSRVSAPLKEVQPQKPKAAASSKTPLSTRSNSSVLKPKSEVEEVNPKKPKAASSVAQVKAVQSTRSSSRVRKPKAEAVDSTQEVNSKKSNSTLPEPTAELPLESSPSTASVDKFVYYEQDQSELFGDLENEEEKPEEFDGKGHYGADIGDVIENGGSNFHVIRKMGFGNFSLAWLAYETRKEAKKFCAIKIYKAEHKTVNCEIKILKMVKNFDHIVQYHRSFQLKRNNCTYDCAVFEPLGSTLLTLLKRANPLVNDHVGLKMDAIKKIARHILLGLNYIHTEMKLVHTDIKPENILTNVTERSLFLAVKDVHDENGEKPGMRAIHYRIGNTPFENGLEEVKNGLQEIMNEIPEPLSLEPKSRMQNRDTVSAEICWDVVKFKIIDLGNAIAPGKKTEAGTFEYRAPENAFAAPLNFSFDVWSVGCVIAELATNQQLFRSFEDEHEFKNLIKSITYYLGKVPYSLYKEYDDPAKLLDEFSADGDAQPDYQRENLTAVFKNKYYDDEEIKQMVEFLLFIFNYDPNQRPTAEECLNHEWLN